MTHSCPGLAPAKVPFTKGPTAGMTLLAFPAVVNRHFMTRRISGPGG